MRMEMEPLNNFRHALETVRVLREAAYESGYAPRTAGDATLAILLGAPRWETEEKMHLIHRKVRRLYLRQRWWDVRVLVTGVDWSLILDWMYANWDKILAIVLFFIL